jgi:hypothetical protein
MMTASVADMGDAPVLKGNGAPVLGANPQDRVLREFAPPVRDFSPAGVDLHHRPVQNKSKPFAACRRGIHIGLIGHIVPIKRRVPTGGEPWFQA